MRRVLLGLAIAFAVISPSLSESQPATRVVRIGWLSGASAEWSAPYLNALRARLYELGYSQTQIVVEARHANGRSDVLPRLAAELVRAKVDVIIAASSTPATQAAKQATTTIPIIMVGAGEPVRTGLVASLARPGGNVTGSTVIGPEIAAKRLQLVRELFPTAADVALLWNPDNPSNAKLHEELRVASRNFGVRLQSVEVSHPERFESALQAMVKDRPAALIATGDPMHQLHMGRVIHFAAKHRLPVVYSVRENVVAGGLMSYGADWLELYQRAATYVSKILKGTKPGDLPIEEPTKFELVINLKTATALGLTIPQSVLVRADDVIQ